MLFRISLSIVSLACAVPCLGCATTPAGHTESLAQQRDDSREIMVKSLATAPFKEALVVYRGRVYAVRPGDKIESIRVVDITDAGLVTAVDGRTTLIVGM